MENSNIEGGDILLDELISACPMTNWFLISTSSVLPPQPPRSDMITISRPLFLDMYVSAESYIAMLSEGER
jgi:hypothetical protein